MTEWVVACIFAVLVMLAILHEIQKRPDPSQYWYKIWKLVQQRVPEEYLIRTLSEEEYGYYNDHRDEFKFGAPLKYNGYGQKLR